MEFQIDHGKRGGPKEVTVFTGGPEGQKSIRGFVLDTTRVRRSKFTRKQILLKLVEGWKLREIEKHKVLEVGDLPTPSTISGAFRVSNNMAFTIVKELRYHLQVHVIDWRKRYDRGDFLVKLQRKFERERVTEDSLRRFFNPNRLKRQGKIKLPQQAKLVKEDKLADSDGMGSLELYSILMPIGKICRSAKQAQAWEKKTSIRHDCQHKVTNPTPNYGHEKVDTEHRFGTDTAGF